MYLHHLLTRLKDEMIRKGYEVQKIVMTKHDWYSLVHLNTKELNISLSKDQISTMKKEKFSLIVKNVVEKKAMEDLNSIDLGHSKKEDRIKPRLIRRPD